MSPGIGETLGRLFGSKASGGAAHEPEAAVDYEGYSIRPEPQAEGKQWLTAGVISKTIDGTMKEHRFLRGDIYADRNSAVEFSIAKGQQIIDLEGDRIFDERS